MVRVLVQLLLVHVLKLYCMHARVSMHAYAYFICWVRSYCFKGHDLHMPWSHASDGVYTRSLKSQYMQNLVPESQAATSDY